MVKLFSFPDKSYHVLPFPGYEFWSSEFKWITNPFELISVEFGTKGIWKSLDLFEDSSDSI